MVYLTGDIQIECRSLHVLMLESGKTTEHTAGTSAVHELQAVCPAGTIIHVVTYELSMAKSSRDCCCQCSILHKPVCDPHNVGGRVVPGSEHNILEVHVAAVGHVRHVNE
jgi:hypothetical protein